MFFQNFVSTDSKARKHQQAKYTSSFIRALKSPTLSLSKSKKYAVSYYNPSPYQSSYPSSYPADHGYPYPSPYPLPYSYPYPPDAGYPGGYPAVTPVGSPTAQPAPVGQSIHYQCCNSDSPRKNRTEKFEIKGKCKLSYLELINIQESRTVNVTVKASNLKQKSKGNIFPKLSFSCKEPTETQKGRINRLVFA